MENESKLTSGLDQNLSKENSIFSSFETKNLSLEQLNLIHKKLSYLCLNFDPFTQGENSIEIDNLIKEFNLEEKLDNPYEYTNYLLKRLSSLEEAIKEKLN